MTDIKKYGQSYDIPEIKEEFVDVEKGEVVDKKNIPPIEIIRALANKYNYKIADPSKGCSHCNGRGYDGVDKDTKQFIPCRCLFRNRTERQRHSDEADANSRIKINRKQRRNFKPAMKKRMASTQKELVTMNEEASKTELKRPEIDIFKPTEQC